MFFGSMDPGVEFRKPHARMHAWNVLVIFVRPRIESEDTMPGDTYSHVFADQAGPAPVMPVTCGGHVTLPPGALPLHHSMCRATGGGSSEKTGA